MWLQAIPLFHLILLRAVLDAQVKQQSTSDVLVEVSSFVRDWESIPEF